MRLSDWSSDVCSSALNPRTLCDRPDLGWRSCRSAARRPICQSPQGSPSPTCRGCPQSGLVEMRSAEHTSELPSLMRISYSVFSLKKNPLNVLRSFSCLEHIHFNSYTILTLYSLHTISLHLILL